MGMIDVTDKPVSRRRAEAMGRIRLDPRTLKAVEEGRIKKGDPFLVAEMAGMLAAKQTHLLIPHCHPIPLEGVEVSFRVEGASIVALCRVRAQARTGVEMEALVGVSMALNTIWDMVKYLEKDEQGQYPGTRITDIQVVSKIKEDV
jgi:cyclic pyranopterin phosphate synthase